MGIEFTSWSNYVEDGVPGVIDWTSADTIRGSRLLPCCAALWGASIERFAQSGLWEIGTRNPFPNIDDYDCMDRQYYVDAWEHVTGFVNHTEYSGDYDGQEEIPMWTVQDVLDYLGDDERLLFKRGNLLSAELIFQQYRVWQLLRWTKAATIGNIRTKRRTCAGWGDTKEEAYAEAVSEWNDSEWQDYSHWAYNCQSYSNWFEESAFNQWSVAFMRWATQLRASMPNDDNEKDVVLYIKASSPYGGTWDLQGSGFQEGVFVELQSGRHYPLAYSSSSQSNSSDSSSTESSSGSSSSRSSSSSSSQQTDSSTSTEDLDSSSSQSSSSDSSSSSSSSSSESSSSSSSESSSTVEMSSSGSGIDDKYIWDYVGLINDPLNSPIAISEGEAFGWVSSEVVTLVKHDCGLGGWIFV